MQSESFLNISSDNSDDIFNLSISTWAIGVDDFNYNDEYKGCEMDVKHIIYEFLSDRRLSLYIINSDFKNHVFRKNHGVYIKFEIMVNLQRRVAQKDFEVLIDKIETYLSSLTHLKYSRQRPKKVG